MAQGTIDTGMAAFTLGKAVPTEEKPPTEIREEKKEDKVDKLQFEEEGFPSLNLRSWEIESAIRTIGTPSGVWENPPYANQPSKVLVIKKVSKGDPAAAFSAAFTSPCKWEQIANYGSKCL
ncbi:Vasculin-like protein 1 [Sciurus carolinensis]|uniref:Vasculin-like protein 1 n=1 Tax=Sciurus carolinensis TaxID=30640 RepID=A0AA41N9H6_SCICA|nr:Vasculin-like protein 1 [Sciurus carolinensis]